MSKLRKGTWSKEEVAILKRGGELKALAKALNRSPNAVDKKIRHMNDPKLKAKVVYPTHPTKASAEKPTLTPLEKQGLSHYKKKVEELERDHERNGVIAKAIAAAASKSYRPLPKTPVRLTGKDGSPVSLIGMLSDWHVGLEVGREETLGRGHYNTQVFLDRLWTLQQKTLEIAKASTSPIEEYVACLIGDQVDSMLQHGAEVENTMTIVDQCLLCAHATAQFLRNMAAVFPKVRVYTTQGNHPRVNPRSKHQPTKGKHSSWDTVVSHLAEGYTRDVPNIEWVLNKAIFQKFDVQGHGVFMSHGDENAGGGQSELSIPLHALGRRVSSMAQYSCKAGEPMPKLLLQGHLHRPFVLPTGVGGAIICNGGMPGDDTYGVTKGFMSCDPSQNLLCVHPAHGLISYHPIYLRDAEPGCGAAYDLQEYL